MIYLLIPAAIFYLAWWFDFLTTDRDGNLVGPTPFRAMMMVGVPFAVAVYLISRGLGQ